MHCAVGGGRCWCVTPYTCVRVCDVGFHTQFLHNTVDQLCGRSVDFYHLYPSSAATTDVVEIAAAYQQLFIATLNGDIQAADLDSVLADNGVPSALHAAVAGVFEARKDDIRAGLVAKLASISSAELKDFDWSLRVRAQTRRPANARLTHLLPRA